MKKPNVEEHAGFGEACTAGLDLVDERLKRHGALVVVVAYDKMGRRFYYRSNLPHEAVVDMQEDFVADLRRRRR